ncbi:hypothetical protein [Solibacillus sp. FSL K6-1523]|uniref:hypothetical protein n=1 Tax=Solibacillus sp. FSL K6-1523 TaxID=2921471 RepID=UPI0030F7BBD3
MTSLNNVSITQNICQQLLWKCRVFSATFSTIVIVQMIFAVLVGSTGSRGSGRGFFEYDERYFSLDLLLIISVISAIMLGWLLATQSIRNDNYAVVTTNFTETVSTLLFLVVLSAFTVLSALSAFYITAFSRLLIFNQVKVNVGSLFELSSLFLFFLFVLLAGSASFFARTLYDFSKVITLLLIISFIFYTQLRNISDSALIKFFFIPDNVGVEGGLIFMIVLFWVLAIGIRQRREVMRR